GAYLAGPVAHCMECHTPFLPEGRPDTSRLGAGGFRIPGPWGVSYAANLTPDVETGLGAWKDGEIIAALYGARRSGGRVLPPHPTPDHGRGRRRGPPPAALPAPPAPPADPEQGAPARAAEAAVSLPGLGPGREGPGPGRERAR